MIVGLTGGIGSGKSVAGDFFIELGIDVIDADHVSKNILDDNESAKKLFLEHFGEKFIDKNNNVDRALLRDEIFKNENCLLYTSPSPRDRQKSRMPSSA